jgi:putative ABC transport system permease protein
MIIFDTLQTALVQLGANKLRTGLTMLGIVIGVGAVIALMAAGQGAQRGVTKEVSALGSNLIFVNPGQTEQGGGPVRVSAMTLTTDDADAIKSLQYVDAVISQYDLSIENQLVGNGRNTTASMVATEPDFTFVRSWEVQAGRFINADDLSRKTTNIVLGAKVAEDLFDTPENAIGQEVRLSFGPFSVNLTVVGVMEERGAGGTGEDDTQILIPLTTFRARIPFGRAAGGSSNNVQQIVVKATGGGKVDETKEDIRALLLERHDYEEDFTVETQNDLTATARDVSRTLTILLGAIAGISLVVGGIGIMNIMLVSVTERTREIGIRKAVGASSGDILLQFVVEAIIVTLVGGALGVMAGVVAARMADGQDFGTGSSVTTAIAPWSIFVALGVSVLIGLFFGIYPAFRASRLNPIEALRAE